MSTLQHDEAIQHAVVVYGKLQSLLHDVERMLESGTKRELKQRLNNFHSWLEPVVSKTTALFDENASQAFTEFTTKLDQLSLEFKVIISDEVQ